MLSFFNLVSVTSFIKLVQYGSVGIHCAQSDRNPTKQSTITTHVSRAKLNLLLSAVWNIPSQNALGLALIKLYYQPHIFMERFALTQSQWYFYRHSEPCSSPKTQKKIMHIYTKN